MIQDNDCESQPLATLKRLDYSEKEVLSPCSSVSNALHGLPLARVKAIMQSGGEEIPISSEGLFTMAKAAEFFVSKLAKESYESNEKPKYLEYSHLSEYVQENDKLEFLHEMVPRMVNFGDIMHLVQQAVTET
ncbi:unnamed protein product [Thelazia callipaeda]|uniref:CBFD_NFYB_HMF domain-containing protein n=1 Tax=Thelazia callipaeda TaxID=103827 RepID=A0A0N5CW55_THECL|nr:unnamed protein product [Thelazia callipaeda]